MLTRPCYAGVSIELNGRYKLQFIHRSDHFQTDAACGKFYYFPVNILVTCAQFSVPQRLDKPEPTNVNSSAGHTWEKVIEAQCPQDRLLSNHTSRMARRYLPVNAPSVGCAIA